MGKTHNIDKPKAAIPAANILCLRITRFSPIPRPAERPSPANTHGRQATCGGIKAEFRARPKIDKIERFGIVMPIVALVVGRFSEKGRRTGNPVQLRDGPRRCNRVLSEAHSTGHCRNIPSRNVWREGRASLNLEVRRPTNALSAILREGRSP